MPPSGIVPSNMPARSRRTSLSRSNHSGRASARELWRVVEPRLRHLFGRRLEQLGQIDERCRASRSGVLLGGTERLERPAQDGVLGSLEAVAESEARSAAIRWWRRISRSAGVSIDPATCPSGFIACAPPGRSPRRVIESASASPSYSRFGSTTNAWRPTPRATEQARRGGRGGTSRRRDLPLPGLAEDHHVRVVQGAV